MNFYPGFCFLSALLRCRMAGLITLLITLGTRKGRGSAKLGAGSLDPT